MDTGLTPRQLEHLPPCCPNCSELMSYKAAHEETLLRGNPLISYRFECNICGYSSARVIADAA